MSGEHAGGCNDLCDPKEGSHWLADDEMSLDELRRDVERAVKELDEAVLEACPSDHRLRQHRDMLRPWCDSCGRDDGGYPIGAKP